MKSYIPKLLLTLCTILVGLSYTLAQEDSLKNVRNQFNKAIFELDFDLINKIIDGGLKVNENSWNGGTFLSYLATYGDTTMLGFALDIGAEDKDVAFRQAVIQKRYDNAEFLIGRGADINSEDGYGQTVITYAIKQQNDSLLSAMLTWGAEPKLKLRYLLCPGEVFTDIQQEFLGDILTDCECSAPDTVKYECGEGMFVRWCERKDASGKMVKHGYEVLGDADCVQGTIHAVNIRHVFLYDNGKLIDTWPPN